MTVYWLPKSMRDEELRLSPGLNKAEEKKKTWIAHRKLSTGIANFGVGESDKEEPLQRKRIGPEGAHYPILYLSPGRTGKTSSQIFLPALLFFVCFGLYVSNGDFLPGGDQQGNMLASVNLVKRHAFSLSPPDAPNAFLWTLQRPGKEPQPVTIRQWTREADDLYARDPPEGREQVLPGKDQAPRGVRQHLRPRAEDNRAAGLCLPRPVRRHRVQPLLVVARRRLDRLPAGSASPRCSCSWQRAGLPVPTRRC